MTAALVYGLLGIVLFEGTLVPARWLTYVPIAASVFGALGTFVLTRRWIVSWPASLLAGAAYGFGPFALGFVGFHPLAGLVPAAVPWLFCPAALWHAERRKSLMDQIGTCLLAMLPFAVIVAFFQLSAAMGFWPVPADRVGLERWTGLLIPQAMPGIGLYHVPLVVAALGLAVHALARRPGSLIVVALGLALSLGPRVLQVSPIAWLAIPVVYAAVLVGLGAQTLAWSGPDDCGVVGLAVVLAMVLAGAMVVLGLRFAPSVVYFNAARFYGLAAVMSAAILFIARSGMRWRGLRWVVLFAAAGLDIFLGAKLLLAQVA